MTSLLKRLTLPGIGQEETASMILYLIYGYSLVAISQGANEDRGAYMDDNFFVPITDTKYDILDKQTQCLLQLLKVNSL